MGLFWAAGLASAMPTSTVGLLSRFTGDGRGKIGTKGEYLHITMPCLREILALAVKTDEAPDSEGRFEIQAFSYLSADIEVGGQRESVVVTVRENTDGRKFYDLNMDNTVGARSGEAPMGAREARVEPDMELGTDTLNLRFTSDAVKQQDRAPAGWGAVDAGPEITPAQMRDITRTVNAEMKRAGPEGMIHAAAVARRRNLLPRLDSVLHHHSGDVGQQQPNLYRHQLTSPASRGVFLARHNI